MGVNEFMLSKAVDGYMNVNWDHVFEVARSLVTERCLLRPPTIDDVPHIFKMMSDEDVTRYLGRFPMASEDEAVQQIQTYLTGFDEQQSVTWVICWREDGSIMGTCSLFNLLKAHFRAELGYILTPEWWGRGIMSEVVRAVIDYGFDNMHLHSIMAQIDPDNDASRRLLEKHGFVQEAYFREDFYHPVQEKFTDTAIFSLLKSVWKNR